MNISQPVNLNHLIRSTKNQVVAKLMSSRISATEQRQWDLLRNLSAMFLNLDLSMQSIKLPINNNLKKIRIKIK